MSKTSDAVNHATPFTRWMTGICATLVVAGVVGAIVAFRTIQTDLQAVVSGLDGLRTEMRLSRENVVQLVQANASAITRTEREVASLRARVRELELENAAMKAGRP